MAEKRFEIMVGGTAWDNLQDKELTPDENIDLLNKLFDENEQLRKELPTVISDASSYLLKIQEIEKENEQLKHDASILVQANKDYRVENEQLRKEVRRLKGAMQEYEEQIGDVE